MKILKISFYIFLIPRHGQYLKYKYFKYIFEILFGINICIWNTLERKYLYLKSFFRVFILELSNTFTGISNTLRKKYSFLVFEIYFVRSICISNILKKYLCPCLLIPYFPTRFSLLLWYMRGHFLLVFSRDRELWSDYACKSVMT